MSIEKSEIERIRTAVKESLHAHWVIFLIEGIVLMVLGMMAVALPLLATIAVEIFIGWLLLVSGLVGLVTSIWMRRAPGFLWSLLSAILGIAAGVVLLWWPLSGALSLTVILTAFLTVEGILSIMYALEHKRDLSGRWGMMLLSGIVDLILAALIFLGLPGTAAWAIGLLVGINLIFGGVTLAAMALHARKIEPPPKAA
ncbi:MAG: HdeD family acid-resistance protein [Steroidobacteraceae bacterium]